MKTNKISYSFKNAFAGMGYFFMHERNGRIQLIIGLLTAITGMLLQISRHEWIVILLCIGAVLSAEMMNSAIEKLCNHIQPSFHIQIKIVKDLAAGAVLFISIISALIGVFIFIPKIYQLL
ncbi:MAG: diacylglycerol kinase family protein [Ginsengibacter sp.]